MSLKCPNCGTDVGENEAYCPNCGDKMFQQTNVTASEEKRQQPTGSSSALYIVSILLLVLIGLPALLCGGCLLLLGSGGSVFSPIPSGGAPEVVPLALGVTGVALFALLLWLVMRQKR